MNIREAALKILYEVDVNKAYTNAQLGKFFASGDIDSRDRALLFELVSGTLKNRMKIDYIISRFSKLKLKKISPWVINILRLGVYQIFFLDKIPNSAACNESTNLAKKYSNKGSVGFVNGILRSVCREINNISFPEKDRGLIDYYSVEYSFPKWITEKLICDFGEEKASLFMKESNKPHGTYVRVNSLKSDCDSILNLFAELGIEAYVSDFAENIIYVLSNIDLTNLEEYKNGLFSLQNVSSKRAVDILNPQKGDIVFDLCAAPGGKSCACAEIMGNEGEIYSFDIHKHKIELINNSAKRLGINIIKAGIADSQILNKSFLNKADKVIADVPCSGVGTIHKKPDIKWTRCEEDIKSLRDIQLNILDCASKYVKCGGEILYSTCTVFKEENSDNINNFLNKNNNFEKVCEEQILTGEKGETGFYICKIKKVSE